MVKGSDAGAGIGVSGVPTFSVPGDAAGSLGSRSARLSGPRAAAPDTCASSANVSLSVPAGAAGGASTTSRQSALGSGALGPGARLSDRATAPRATASPFFPIANGAAAVHPRLINRSSTVSYTNSTTSAHSASTGTSGTTASVFKITASRVSPSKANASKKTASPTKRKPLCAVTLSLRRRGCMDGQSAPSDAANVRAIALGRARRARPRDTARTGRGATGAVEENPASVPSTPGTAASASASASFRTNRDMISTNDDDSVSTVTDSAHSPIESGGYLPVLGAPHARYRGDPRRTGTAFSFAVAPPSSVSGWPPSSPSSNGVAAQPPDVSRSTRPVLGCVSTSTISNTASLRLSRISVTKNASSAQSTSPTPSESAAPAPSPESPSPSVASREFRLAGSSMGTVAPDVVVPKNRPVLSS